MWSSSPTTARQINYGLPEMGMLGLRDVFVVADHHAHHPHSINASVANANAATALGVGVIPLLTATQCLNVDENMLNRSGGGRGSNTNTSNNNNNSNFSIQFWQQHQPQPHNYLTKPVISDHGFLQASVGGGGGGSTSTSGSTMTCQDCGNQAKKDCSHRRCRTCCKSRGFDCSTHVKSTWVPAARRRERQLMTSTGAASVSSASTSGPKKPRLTSHTTTNSHTSTSNTTPPRSVDTSSSHHKQDASFKESLPGQVRAPAVFKCVRVTAVEDGGDEYAYQASATIGGHVFKGFLYDQGVETRDNSSFPNFSELHLGGTGAGTGTGVGRNVGGSSSLLDAPPDVFATSGGGLLTGSTYGNQIN
ncbi:hypothetical protein M8C21_029874 [Ambrosia artemisiifolia]|uniref:Uncharacterized protein n=1 Tax=Ambrosia artemisiifolia TaxID=4212 RepID=A0AAD5CDL9_AMBAR|nr:hypothetical protein M8C21_029874 [Ambrosia artemisiifolia]